MAYITQADFTAYTTTGIPTEDFTGLANRASEVLDILTGYKIPAAGGLDTYPPFVQEQVKKATSAQVETMHAQGGNDTVIGWGAESGIASANIGKFGYSSGAAASGGNTGKAQTLNGTPLSPLLNGYLWPTGLLYPGVVCRG